MKIKVTKKAAAKKVKRVAKAAKGKVPKKVAKKKAKPVKTGNLDQTLPKGVFVLQPPTGETAVVGTILQVGRRKYGGNYFAKLTPANYTLAKSFMAKVLSAIQGSEGRVTPTKLLLNVPNAHGTPTRVFAIENSAGSLHFHARYFNQSMFNLCHKAKVQVFGDRPKGAKIGGVEIKAPLKAHSNSIILTQETLALAVSLSQEKAASL